MEGYTYSHTESLCLACASGTYKGKWDVKINSLVNLMYNIIQSHFPSYLITHYCGIICNHFYRPQTQLVLMPARIVRYTWQHRLMRQFQLTCVSVPTPLYPTRTPQRPSSRPVSALLVRLVYIPYTPLLFTLGLLLELYGDGAILITQTFTCHPDGVNPALATQSTQALT